MEECRSVTKIAIDFAFAQASIQELGEHFRLQRFRGRTVYYSNGNKGDPANNDRNCKTCAARGLMYRFTRTQETT
ncbi:hypothetical protein TNCV_2298591 [Trichonephila clavipes]|nr:hypothetical protein TNCV_2298591 [Trichonephila clavipes]